MKKILVLIVSIILYIAPASCSQGPQALPAVAMQQQILIQMAVQAVLELNPQGLEIDQKSNAKQPKQSQQDKIIPRNQKFPRKKTLDFRR